MPLLLILRALRRDVALPLPCCSKAARAEMGRVLDTMQKDERRYAHPVVGPLSATQMLVLAGTHTAYHQRQMDALRRDAAFPRVAPI